MIMNNRICLEYLGAPLKYGFYNAKVKTNKVTSIYEQQKMSQYFIVTCGSSRNFLRAQCKAALDMKIKNELFRTDKKKRTQFRFLTKSVRNSSKF